ncbi:MAG: hypothetical protein CMF50_02570 [Legionellales bacterium]|nr:hypothetical protein [Legionellales bacterium]|tara:strand:+ start:19202 stop:19963 length:762 start_codon:yes stop_codon:yes gene_type:complete
MDLIQLKILFLIIILASGLIGGLYPLLDPLKKRHYGKSEAFACGIFVGAALFHMLPDAESAYYQLYHSKQWPQVAFFCAIGMVFLWFIRRLSQIVCPQDDRHILAIIPYILALILSLHAFIAGASLGLGNSIGAISIIAIAIIAHKGTASFALSVNLRKSATKYSLQIYTIVLFTLMTPLGILFGANLQHILSTQQALFYQATFNAIAAGTFIYIASLQPLGQQLMRGHKIVPGEIVSAIFGILLMAIIGIWV